jgi:hypothetical protein
LKKITNAIKKTRIIPNATRDKRNIIGTIKDNGVTITNLTGLSVNGEHSLIMLVYNIKRSYWRMSDLIPNSKWNSPYKAQLVLSVTNYFRLLKIVLQISYNLPPKTAFRTIYCRLGYVLFVKLSEKEFFHSLISFDAVLKPQPLTKLLMRIHQIQRLKHGKA